MSKDHLRAALLALPQAVSATPLRALLLATLCAACLAPPAYAATEEVKPETQAFRKVLAAGARLAKLEESATGKAIPADDEFAASKALISAQAELAAFNTNLGNRLLARSLVYYFGERATDASRTQILKLGKAIIPYLEAERGKALACVQRYAAYCLTGKPGMQHRNEIIAELVQELKNPASKTAGK